MQTGSTWLQRLAWIENSGEHFIIDCNELESLFSHVGCLSGYDGRIITNITHNVIQAILVTQTTLHRALFYTRIGHTRYIFIGQNSMHSRQSLRRRYVDLANNRMSMRAGQNTPIQHAARLNVVGKNWLTSHEFDGVDTLDRLAHDLKLRFW